MRVPKLEKLSRIAQTTAALTRLKPVWNDRSLSLSSKIRLMHSLVTSIFLYACESWTLTVELQRRIQAMEIGAAARYYASQTKTMLPTKKAVRGQNHLARHSESGKTTRQTEEEVGRQHQGICLLYTSPSPRDCIVSRMPSSA